MELILPLPDQKLRPNVVHATMAGRLGQNRLRQEYRAMVREEAMVWCYEHTHDYPAQAATIQLAFYFARHGKRDPDNLIAWCKPLYDGLRDAGVLLDDDRLTHLPPIVRKDADNPRLEVWLFKDHDHETEKKSDRESETECNRVDGAPASRLSSEAEA